MHINSTITRAFAVAAAALSLAGLAAVGASPAAADDFETFQIVSDQNPSLCVAANRTMWKDNNPGPWRLLTLDSCDEPSGPASTTRFMWSRTNEMRPTDSLARCLGGPPCAANVCVDANYFSWFNVEILGCTGSDKQQFSVTAGHQVRNGRDMCLTTGNVAVGALVERWGCGAPAPPQQRWTLRYSGGGGGATVALRGHVA